jgi:hypothetical protein
LFSAGFHGWEVAAVDLIIRSLDAWRPRALGVCASDERINKNPGAYALRLASLASKYAKRMNHCLRTLSWIVVAGLAGAAIAEDGPATSHWAFQPMRRSPVPTVMHRDLVRTPVDAFILEKLEAAGLVLSPPADRMTLLRRVTFDLTGLPPTTSEIDAFLADDAPDAYERLVDRLLSSPQYGEAWGRTWLDLVRFAETAGFNADPARPLAYKYRDYVLRAFNEDTPYDRFIAEQLAGDELFPEDADALAATGYNRMWPDESNASNVLLARQAALNDLTANVGSVFLGLSIGCAQCHDHKFDPLLQTDFYQLQAFFAGIVLQDKRPVVGQSALLEYERKKAAWLSETAPLRQELHAIESAGRAVLGEIKRLKFPREVLDAVDAHPAERTPMQHQLAFWSERQIEIDDKDLPTVIDDFARERREVLQRELATAKKREPKPPNEASVMAVTEICETPPVTHLLAVGSYEDPLEETPPGFPVVLRGENAAAPQITPPRSGTSGRRTALAKWLASPDNALPHRVVANRIWQGHFGRGLVENANDFGTQTPTPSHPELLDWLAGEFIQQGFSWKQLHRTIVLSATYRQAAFVRSPASSEMPGFSKKDPDNELYWHYPRQRLSSERIRDAWLAASGQLNEAMYGTGVRPELPPNFGGAASWKVSENPADRTRRSVYIYAKRNLPYPMMQAFDFPDMHESCGCRTQTVIAPQALLLLNSQLVVNAAAKLAERVRAEADTADPYPALRVLWRTTYGRDPSEKELRQASEFLSQQQAALSKETEGGAAAEAETSAWTDLCHAVLNSNEFLYVE